MRGLLVLLSREALDAELEFEGFRHGGLISRHLQRAGIGEAIHQDLLADRTATSGEQITKASVGIDGGSAAPEGVLPNPLSGVGVGTAEVDRDGQVSAQIEGKEKVGVALAGRAAELLGDQSFVADDALAEGDFGLDEIASPRPFTALALKRFEPFAGAEVGEHGVARQDRDPDAEAGGDQQLRQGEPSLRGPRSAPQ